MYFCQVCVYPVICNVSIYSFIYIFYSFLCNDSTCTSVKYVYVRLFAMFQSILSSMCLLVFIQFFGLYFHLCIYSFLSNDWTNTFVTVSVHFYAMFRHFLGNRSCNLLGSKIKSGYTTTIEVILIQSKEVVRCKSLLLSKVKMIKPGCAVF